MKLNLKRPIVFFDLETTGVDTAKDRIVEISMVKVMPDGEQIVKTRKLNPGIHIPAEATAIHGITDEDVKDCPTFAQVAKSLEQFIRGCDFGGFNSNRFDLPVLVEEFLRAGVDVDFKRRRFVDVQNIFHKKEQRTLVAAYKFYCDKDLEDACLGMNPQGNPKLMRQQLEDSGRGFALRETAERLKAARFVASQAKITVADAPASPAADASKAE